MLEELLVGIRIRCRGSDLAWKDLVWSEVRIRCWGKERDGGVFAERFNCYVGERSGRQGERTVKVVTLVVELMMAMSLTMVRTKELVVAPVVVTSFSSDGISVMRWCWYGC